MAGVILIGMPGAGKSTVGVVLAKVLGMPFVDTDLLIQQNEQMLLQKIIDKNGINFFLKCEERIILKSDFKNMVVATGGSAVYSQKAMEYLAKFGTIIFLNVPLTDLKKRIKNFSKRGVIDTVGGGLEIIYKERLPLYRKYADLVVNSEKSGIEDTVAGIVKSLEFK